MQGATSQWRFTWSRRQFICLTMVVGIVPSTLLAYTSWIVLADGLLTENGHLLVVRDYLWLWGAGQLLRVGDLHTIFDPNAFAASLRGHFGAKLVDHAWSYPPSLLFLAVPAGYVPILWGYALFAAAQMALLWWIGRLAGLTRGILAAVLVSPAAIENMLGGQNGAMTSALLIGGLSLAGRRSILSGILFGLLTIKPQLGLIIPCCLLASRDWKAIAAAICTAVGLAALSIAAFGFQSWTLYWDNVRPFMAGILEAEWRGIYYQRTMITPFMAARSYHLGLTASYLLQAVMTLAVIATAWWIWRSPTEDVNLRTATTVCLVMLATPYGYTYDTVCLAIAVGIVAMSGTQIATYEGVVLALAWMWPGLALWASFLGLVPLGCVLIAALSWIAFRRLQNTPSSAESQHLLSKGDRPFATVEAHTPQNERQV